MKRYGLVIGNAAYALEPLDNTLNDARTVHQALQARGFDASLICDASTAQMADAVAALKARLEPGDLLFFFFAGHAFEHLGYGYLMPVDIPEFTAGAIRHYAYPVDELLRETQGLGTCRVVVLDACRDAFDEADLSFRSLIESIHQQRADSEKHQRNLLLSYSTSYGASASDGSETNSPFTKVLTTLLPNHRLNIEEMFKEVGCSVIRNTNNQQRPWFYSSLETDVKMSDLPTYQQRQSFYAPTKGSLYALASSRDHSALFLVGSAPYIYHLGSHGPKGSIRCEDGVKAASVSNSGAVFLLNGKDCLVIPHLSHTVDLSHIEPIGITSSNDGRFVLVYGDQEFVIFQIGPATCDRIHYQHGSDRYFYCAEFVDDSQVWIGGDCHAIHAIQLDGATAVCQIIELPFTDYVYAMTPVTDARVLLATSSGGVYMINRASRVAGLVMNLGESVRLPSSRRSSLLHVTGEDQIINTFLFAPKEMDHITLKRLGEHLRSNELLYAVRSTSLPLMAIGSSEGLITIIDTRNWDNYQQLDASGGRETELTGLAFTADNTLVAATKDCHVLFYAPINERYSASLTHIDTHVHSSPHRPGDTGDTGLAPRWAAQQPQ
ncbi:caspase family protein [Pseudomonas sp. JDS08PS003]|uniref:caspase family protein n=1 Tax=Pseudomonas sp. JDS08PS003 TaxID=2497162 RepID=UPI003857AB35